ncbi:MAG: D-alanyl-D-alanine carboxypeptidase family protein [Magnetococcales bacterium]|nr:D-alanyl-D-alanine carboxypeptidase family protein [Magnetococcales bacterium]
MDRRGFLKILTAGAAAAIPSLPFGTEAWAASATRAPESAPKTRVSPDSRDDDLDSYLHKVRYFNEDHPDDVFLKEEQFNLLQTSVKRFNRIQKMVGFGNFYILDFDQAVSIARSQTEVGPFSVEEINFLEQLFYASAADYGFYGEKPLRNLTDRIPMQEVIKLPGTGNYLFRGQPEAIYHHLRKELGDQVVLTSGVRSVIKQFLLFLTKVSESQGNLSRASRSLAPPGYSFHGVSDFDVGQAGLGAFNFTERFVTTPVFRRLRELGYLRLRYPRDNLLGVRFEPWHIKVNVHADAIGRI